MKQDSMSADVRQLSGKRNGPVSKRTNEDLNVAEEREQIAGMIKQPSDNRDEAETETSGFISGLTPHQVVEKSISFRTQLDAAVDHHAQSGRVSGYAAVDCVRREDPW